MMDPLSNLKGNVMAGYILSAQDTMDLIGLKGGALADIAEGEGIELIERLKQAQLILAELTMLNEVLTMHLELSAEPKEE